jgi:hypothetical protein
VSTAAAAQVWQMGAVELAGAIKRRQVSCLEVVQAHLERMDAVNASVNAVVVVLAEQARRAAAAADRVTAAGGELPVGFQNSAAVAELRFWRRPAVFSAPTGVWSPGQCRVLTP